MEYFFVYNNALWIHVYVFVVFVVLATAVVGVMFVNNINNYMTAITCSTRDKYITYIYLKVKNPLLFASFSKAAL